jgi:hypothetical protein
MLSRSVRRDCQSDDLSNRKVPRRLTIEFNCRAACNSVVSPKNRNGGLVRCNALLADALFSLFADEIYEQVYSHSELRVFVPLRPTKNVRLVLYL